MSIACVSLVRNREGKILCVWNQRFEGYTLPGGKREPTETLGEAQERELWEETGLDTAEARMLFSDWHENALGRFLVVVFSVRPVTELAYEAEPGSPVRWLSDAELVAESPFGAFYAKMLSACGDFAAGAA